MSDTTENVGATEPRSKIKRVSWQKPAIFCLCLVPLAWLIVWAVAGDLGANPIEAITRYLGDWALRFILIALAVTPIRVLTGWTAVGRFRRMLGLFAFFYLLLHLSSYVGLDQFFYWSGIWQDIVKRIYITLGVAAAVLLALLAATSTDKMVNRLGGKRWRELHRLVYLAAVLGVIHFFMMLKADYTEPTIYAVVLAGLFGVRVYKKWV